MQVRFRHRVTIIRGNHESRQITQVGVKCLLISPLCLDLSLSVSYVSLSSSASKSVAGYLFLSLLLSFSLCLSLAVSVCSSICPCGLPISSLSLHLSYSCLSRCVSISLSVTLSFCLCRLSVRCLFMSPLAFCLQVSPHLHLPVSASLCWPVVSLLLVLSGPLPSACLWLSVSPSPSLFIFPPMGRVHASPCVSASFLSFPSRSIRFCVLPCHPLSLWVSCCLSLSPCESVIIIDFLGLCVFRCMGSSTSASVNMGMQTPGIKSPVRLFCYSIELPHFNMFTHHIQPLYRA